MLSTIVIAAAGKGTRMKELAVGRPKHLIPVQGRPFIEHLLENVKAAGFTRIIVVVGYQKEILIDFLHRYDPAIVSVDQAGATVGGTRYGTAIPIIAAKQAVGGEQFVAVYGDNLYAVDDLAALRALDDGSCYVAGIDHLEPERYGVLVKNLDGTLAAIVEKPQEYVGSTINTGLYKFTSDIFAALEQISISPRGEWELTDGISALAQQGKVRVKTINQFWHDFGKPEDIERLEAFLQRIKG